MLSLLVCSAQIWAVSLGELAGNILIPTTGLGNLVVLASYVAGVGLILGAILQYRAHRENPQQIRLSTPVALLILGLALIIIPWLSSHSLSASFLGT